MDFLKLNPWRVSSFDVEDKINRDEYLTNAERARLIKIIREWSEENGGDQTVEETRADLFRRLDAALKSEVTS